MKYPLFILLFLLAGNTSAQYFINDSIQWKLSSNDSATSKAHPFGLRGANQKTGAGITTLTYIDGYQKIAKPANGWPAGIDVLSNNRFIDFPFGFSPDICFDTTGGYRYCLGYSFFNLKLLKITAVAPQINEPFSMEVYFYDTSCFASREGTNYKYLGELRVSSTNLQEAGKIELIVPETNNGTPYACGAGGRFSSVRLYPKSGADLFIKDVTISGSSGVLLPINFKYVNAAYKDGYVKIRWQIDNLQDLQHFIIQRSTDGRTFRDAEIIESSGLQNVSGEFSWIDKKPPQTNGFYRIKAVERSGKVILSKVVKITDTKQPGITVFPNPVINRVLNLSMNDIPFSKYQLTLINQTGQTVYSFSLSYAGEHQKQIQLPSVISSGSYTLKIKNTDYSWHSKVLIL